ncbi:alpha/beta fold hydrolase [Phenylobacterium terrae]|uniref:Alpha/beta fold hydrolase n=1 Tax=Phenylobacterium terrae TaxID=2665495 RepID=A0ABW4MW24_9CAUL
MRRLKRWALGVVVVIAAAVVSGFVLRAAAQAAAASTAQIGDPAGISEAGYVRINGTEQWVTIRGRDRANPVLLILDGGPGYATSHLVPHPLEDRFTIVKWDQPGAGRSFARAGRRIDPGLTDDRFAEDGIAVAEHVRRRLGKARVGLLASSWGTYVGVNMIRRRPELFYAYVGAGQVVHGRMGEEIGYRQVLAKARARGDRRAIAELERLGPPPWRSQDELGVQRRWAMAYEDGAPGAVEILGGLMTAPGFSLDDARNWMDGFRGGTSHFYRVRQDRDLFALGPEFDTPIFVFQGEADDFTPHGLAWRWFQVVEAPRKRFVTVRGGGHFAQVSHWPQLRRLLVEEVRPLGMAAKS